jgi:hypothetical protein
MRCMLDTLEMKQTRTAADVDVRRARAVALPDMQAGGTNTGRTYTADAPPCRTPAAGGSFRRRASAPYPCRTPLMP